MKPTDIAVYTITENEFACGTISQIDESTGMLRLVNGGVTRAVHKSRIVSTTETAQVPVEREYYHQVMRAIG